MERRFKEGTQVYTNDGQELGRLKRVVIDPENKEVTHIVIREGLLFTEDKVVAVDWIGQADETLVKLKPDVDLSDLQPFEETHFLPMSDEEQVQSIYPNAQVRPVYWYPPVGATQWGAPNVSFKEQYAVDIEQKIPEGTVAMKEGAGVYSSDGEHVGAVERVFTNTGGEQATHLVVSEGLLLKERKLVPTAWIRKFGEEEVHLRVGSSLLDQLPEYER